MATVDGMLLQLESETQNANIVKEIVLDELINQSLITEEQAKEFNEKWQVIIVKNSWFTSWMKKFKRSESDWSYKIVQFEK